MDMIIVSSPISIANVAELARKQFGDVIKATVDISKKIIVVGGELHADEENLLLKQDSAQKNLWGINLYPAKFNKDDFVEFDSMINIRPSQNNMSRGVDDPVIQKRIIEVVTKLIVEKL